jgi:hypothetical protein
MFAEDQKALRVELAAVYAEKDAQFRDFELAAADLARAEARIAALETEALASREEVAQFARRSVELVAVAESLPLLQQRADSERLRANQLAEKLDHVKSKLVDSDTTAKALTATVAERDRKLVELQAKIESDKELVTAIHDLARAQKIIASKI